MPNISHFKIVVLTLIYILVFTVSPASADKNKLERIVGVIVPLPVPNANIPFPPNPQFTVDHPSTGIFLITIDERFACTLRNNGTEQAAKGSRLATLAFDGNAFVVSPLVFVVSDVSGICNETSLYQVTVRNRTDGSLVNGSFSFQIIGSRTNNSPQNDDDDD